LGQVLYSNIHPLPLYVRHTGVVKSIGNVPQVRYSYQSFLPPTTLSKIERAVIGRRNGKRVDIGNLWL